MVTGRTRKITGIIMAISLRPPISSRLRLRASRTSAAWARNTSPSGVPRSTATATPSTKRASGASVVLSATPSSAWTNPAPARASAMARRSSRVSSPLLSCDRQCQEIGDRWELRKHPLLAVADRLGEPVVAGDDAPDRTARAEDQQQDRRAATADEQQAHANCNGEAHTGPDHLLDPELVQRQHTARLVQPSTNRCTATQDPFEQVRALGQMRPHQPLESGKRCHRAGVLQIPPARRLRGQLTHVGRQPSVESWSAADRKSRPGQSQAAADRQAEDCARGRIQCHRSTRASSGSRPRRSISR
jgi:hypothetical protein